MKRVIQFSGILVFLLMFASKEVHSQDLHYSQFYNSPLNINPALTGIFNGDMRFAGSLRDQWRSVPVPYLTFSANYDMKYYMPDFDKGFWGFGGIINYDQAGDGNYNLTDLNGLVSYTYQINKSNLITAGGLVGFASEGYNGNNLSWDSQWNGDSYDPASNPGEPVLNARDRFAYFETGLGLNYRWQKSSRTKIDAGIGVFHLLTPNNAFDNDNDNIDLPIRYDLGLTANFKLSNPLDIQIHGNYKLQQIHDELMLGALAKIYINQNRGKELGLHLGSSYRTSGFLMPTIALDYRQFYLGFSYDVNLTPFKTEQNIWQGGPELHFTYIITKVKALSQFKVCPIF